MLTVAASVSAEKAVAARPMRRGAFSLCDRPKPSLQNMVSSLDLWTKDTFVVRKGMTLPTETQGCSD
ncbi:hypothetical protein GCM10022630_20560 [Thermobifida alba]